MPTSSASRAAQASPSAVVQLGEDDRLKVDVTSAQGAAAVAETIAQLQLVDLAAAGPSSESSVLSATEESLRLETLRSDLLRRLMSMDLQQALAMAAAHQAKASLPAPSSAAAQASAPAQASAAAQASAPAQTSAAAQASTAPTQNSAAAQASTAPTQESATAPPWRHSHEQTETARTPIVVPPRPRAAVAQHPQILVPMPPPAVPLPPPPPAAKAPRVVPPKQAAAKRQGMWQHPSGQWLPAHRHTPRGGSSKKSDWHRRWGLAKAAGISWDTFVAEAGPPPPKSAP